MQHYGNENWAGTPLHTDSVQCRCTQSQCPNRKLNLKRIDKKFWKWYKNDYHTGYDNANKF